MIKTVSVATLIASVIMVGTTIFAKADNDTSHTLPSIVGPTGPDVRGGLDKGYEKTGVEIPGSTWKDGVVDPNDIWVLRKYGVNSGVSFSNAFNPGSGGSD